MADPTRKTARPVALVAAEVAPRAKRSVYPDQFAVLFTGREKRPLGDAFGLSNFGVNLTRLLPKAASALRHAHTSQDELVFVLRGTPTLYTDQGPTLLAPGMCAGFKAGTGDAHRLVNETDQVIEYLEIGDRSPGDAASYPDDDLCAQLDETGAWRFTRKDGTPY